MSVRYPDQQLRSLEGGAATSAGQPGMRVVSWKGIELGRPCTWTPGSGFHGDWICEITKSGLRLQKRYVPR